MRKALTILALVAASVVALAGLAGTASADVPTPTGTYADPPGTPGGAIGHSCTTPNSYGVINQYGAWGYYIDGCTAPNTISCWKSSCLVRTITKIDEVPRNGHRVTQNARIRLFNSAGQLRYFHDLSCSGTNTCGTADAAWMSYGDTVTVQCNGVREASRYIPISQSYNYCAYRIYY